MSIKNAFNSAAKNYDQARKQLIPCFDEFYGTALELIPFDSSEDIKVLDLGAGTGLFSYFATQRYPNATYTLYDLSEQMLEQAEKRFADSCAKINFVIKDYSKETITDKFDLIISALSIHHLMDIEKETLFQKLFFALKSSGLFINADQVMGETPYADKIYRSVWLKQVKEKGVSDATLTAAFERMKEDKMSTLSDQMHWLKKAGFSDVECWYQNFSFAVYSGRKLMTGKDRTADMRFTTV